MPEAPDPSVRPPDRAAALDVQRRCRTAYAGGEAVKRYDWKLYSGAIGGDPVQAMHQLVEDGIAGRPRQFLFLPPRPGMEWIDYEAYTRQALWSGIPRRTVEGLAGVLFREQPAIEGLPKGIADDVGGGRDAAQFGMDLAAELLIAGEVGVLADIDDRTGKPMLKVVRAEDLLEHGPEEARVLGYRMDRPGRWERKEVQRVYVMTRGPWAIVPWEQDPDKGWQPAEPERVPKVNGNTVPEIPLTVARVDEDPLSGPPIAGVVDLAVDHYRVRAAEAFALHTVLPTLVVTGSALSDEQLKKVRLGVRSILSFAEQGAKVEYVGLEGDLKPFRERIQNTEELAARMGARMLTPPKAAAEAAETIRLRQSGEGAALVHLADAVDAAMTGALRWLALFHGRAVEPTYRVDRTALLMDHQRVEQLRDLVTDGIVDERTVIRELIRMHVLPEDAVPPVGRPGGEGEPGPGAEAEGAGDGDDGAAEGGSDS